MRPNRGIFRLYPLVPLCVSLVLGIHLGFAFCASVDWLWLFGAFAAVLIVAFFVSRRPVLQSFLLLFSCALFGLWLAVLAERNVKMELPRGETSYEAVIVSEPVERGRTLRFDMIVASGPLAGRTVRASLLRDTVTCRYRSLQVGDGIKATSRFESPPNLYRSNFDYVTYLKGRGIVATTFIYYRNWRESVVSLSRLSVAQRAHISAVCCRHSLLQRFRALGLAGQDFAVVAAMSLGDKSGLSDDVVDAYSATGTSHVLALSGMHLSIIYALLSLLALGRRGGMVRECLLLFAIWAYVFLVGMAPSVLRSAIMITVYSVMGLTGRSRMSVNALAFAAIVLLVANPFVLYDIGFQLSFMAVAFIIVFSFVFGLVPYKYQQEHPVARCVWQVFAMSLLAQLGTAPLVAYYFGRLPVYSLLTNFVAVPAATVILYASAAALVLFAVPVVRTLVALLLSFVANGLNAVLLFVASLPCASIGGIRINLLQVVLAYIVIVCLLLLLRIFIRCREADVLRL